VLYIIHSVHHENYELFTLRLLRRSYARTWEELPTRNGEGSQTFSETAGQFESISNRDEQTQIYLQDGIEFHRPRGDICFRLAQLVYHGASRETLEDEFYEYLADESDIVGSGHRKIDLLLHPGTCGCCNNQEDDQFTLIWDLNSPLAL
jgi:hypothetical protein